MAITLEELDPAKSSSFNTNAYPKGQKDAIDDGKREVQYRQLISRAVTQRLHSPSLDDLTKTDVNDTLAHTLEAWEVQERCIARNKAWIETEMLGIPWSKTVLPLACIAPLLHIGLNMRMQGLTADSAICPRC